MSDLFDEKEDLKTFKGMATFLRAEYQRKFVHYNAGINDGEDQQTVATRTLLAIGWPGDDIVRQLIIDTVFVMKHRGIKIEDMK